MLRKTSAAAAVIAFVTAGSALFGGAALANEVTNAGGPGGNGGVAENNCLNIALQVPVLNLFGSNPSNAASCTATANGGAGGDAAIGG